MSDELIQAVRKRVGNPPVPPLTEAEVINAEARLGFRLPALLRELYLNVGNGRFGPGFGILPLVDLGDGERYVVDLYLENCQDYPSEPNWKWPRELLPICDWGCNIHTCVDCDCPPNAVKTFEYVNGPMAQSFVLTRASFESWLRDWLNGVELFDSCYEPAPEFDRVGKNPKTGEPMVLKGRKRRQG